MNPLSIAFALLFAGPLLTLSLTSSSIGEDQRPNVLLLFADDLGYSDLECFGGQHARTPRLNRLAKEGLRFTNFYAGAPNCSPSRACLLTGRIPARTGIYNYISNRDPMFLPTKEVTIAELLKDAGYATMHAGKWHLNHGMLDSNQPQPGDHGFDYSLGTQNNASPSHRNPVNFVRNREAVGEIDGYSCDVVVSEIKHWLRNDWNRKSPFFVCAWFHETHSPIASPQALVRRHPNKNPKDAKYAANVENLDQAIGHLVDHLDSEGLGKDTMVIFASDNGGLNRYSNGGFRGRKSFVWEGGIRVPGIIRWPARIPAGTTCEQPAGVVDILPTLARIGKARPNDNLRLDGSDLSPTFSGQKIERSQPLFWFFYRNTPAAAVREEKWSLVGYLEQGLPKSHSLSQEQMKWLKSARLTRFELYDLSEDPGQEIDLSDRHPDVKERLKHAMLNLHKQVLQDGPDWDFAKFER